MRQAGIVAAAGLIAIEESPKRLVEDHENARALACGITNLSGISLDLSTVTTNIVIFDVHSTGRSPDQICDGLRSNGVLASGFGTSIRMVTHRDISHGDVETAVGALAKVVE